MKTHLVALSLFFLSFLVVHIPLCAQSYSALWKEVSVAQQKNLPKTAIQTVDKIIRQARRENNGGEMLKALLTRGQLNTEIAPDSAETFVVLLENNLKVEKSAAMQALYHAVLGRLHAGRNVRLYEDALLRAKDHYLQSVQNPELLHSVLAENYVPFVILGEDSRYFKGDLLHVVTRFSGQGMESIHNRLEGCDSCCHTIYNKAAQVYRRSGNREAEFFIMLDSADVSSVPAYYGRPAVVNEDSRNPKIDFYKDLISRFGDLDVCVEAYIRLVDLESEKNAYECAMEGIRRYSKTRRAGALSDKVEILTRPRLSINVQQSQAFPQMEDSITVEAVNLSHATLRFYRTGLSADNDLFLRLTKATAKPFLKNPVLEVPIQLRKGEPYESVTQKVAFQAPGVGTYIVMLEGDGLVSDVAAYYVSRLHIMQLSLSPSQTRLVVSSAEDGKPMPGVKVSLRSGEQNRRVVSTLITNEKGEVLVNNVARRNLMAYAATSDDTFCPGCQIMRVYNGAGSDARKIINTSLFTDRAIYRPGQTVQVGGFLYEKQGDSTAALSDSVTLKLSDANGKEVARAMVKSDAFGSFSSAFRLPSSCLNGHFSVMAKNGSCSFRVEEYKRPTFMVEFDDVKSVYALGESVPMRGDVKTYSGFPLSDTRVAVTVKRRSARYFFVNYGNERQVFQDTLTTGSDGTFTLNVRLEAEASDVRTSYPLYLFEVEAVAISASGESESSTYRLYAGRQSSFLSTTLPQRVCRDSEQSFQMQVRNAASQLVDTLVCYEVLKNGKQYMMADSRSNAKIDASVFKSLPSGEYELRAWIKGNTDSAMQLRHRFAWFSLHDKQPVGSAPLQLYQSSASFDEKEVLLYVATPLSDAWLRYDLFAKDSLLESKLLHLSNEAITMPYKYKEEYGDGICATFSLVQKGTIHHQVISIRKPEPRKQLQLRWTSFRDHLQAGQDETWILQVLKDGKPAEASLMATLYDASLDKFTPLRWPFSLYFDRFVPNRFWNAHLTYGFGLDIMQAFRFKNVPDLRFSHFDESLFASRIYGSNVMLKSRKAALPMAAQVMQDNAVETVAMSNGLEMKSMAVATEETAVTAENGAEGGSEIRTDFSETAFFMPTLTTNANGEAVMRFTLPQSLTQWNFKALAHTKNIDYGVLDTLVVVSKDFMVQPNMPRFLRTGDKTDLAVTLRNATSRSVSGTVRMELIDPASGRCVVSQSNDFSLQAQSVSVTHFPLKASGEYPLLICRISGASDGFSDGEQHYLPVLSDVQEMTESLPLTLTSRGTQTTSLHTLFGGDVTKTQSPRLTVEYTSNPVWLALEALPSLAAPMNYNAVSMATAFYAIKLAQREAQAHPVIQKLAARWRDEQSVDSLFLLLERNDDLKQVILNESPWVVAAEGERERLLHLAELFDTNTLALRSQSYLDRLLSMQNADGSWSWFKGMPGNAYTTIEVCETLAKLGVLQPDAFDGKATESLQRAQRYLDSYANKKVDEMKRWQQKHKGVPTVDSGLLRYLNICSLRNLKLSSDRSYLVGLLEKSARSYNMYDKALAVGVLKQAGKLPAARITLQSLMEHTVERPGMGRWFDTDRAQWSWNSYRIPTQVAALDALTSLTPGDTTSIEQMTRWLLQAKRTQTWDNPRSSVDAIYYLFLHTPWLAEPSQPAEMQLSLLSGAPVKLQKPSTTDEAPQPLGYVRHTLTSSTLSSQPKLLTVEKLTDGPAFGAVHAQYLLPMSEVKAAANELHLTVLYFVRRGQEWQSLTAGTTLREGDLVRVRYELTADRDFDFVTLKEGRPACGEPVQALSGYDYTTGGYRAVGDASTSFFFTQLRKGKHIVESQWRLDRSGSFTSAVPTVQCAYAPEFNAHAQSQKWIIEP